MRKIAIIGAGIAGLLAAHGLRRAGFDVTVFSDRTADQWLSQSRPTGSAARFDSALSYERELGLDRWHDQAPAIAGVHMIYCPAPGLRLAALMGLQERPAYAIDVRLQSHHWMNELEARGGRVVIESVTRARLDAIAAEHGLTIVAAGKAELGGLFERDAGRSVHVPPRRNVAMVTVKGPSMTAPMGPGGRLLLMAQHGSDGVRTDGPQVIANLFASAFEDPSRILLALTDTAQAKRVIAEATGRSWIEAVARGALGVAGGQIRRGLTALRARV